MSFGAIGGGGGSGGGGGNYVNVAIYDFGASEYPARPSAALVYWIGPVEPTGWTGYDEWRQVDEPPSLPGAPTSITASAGNAQATVGWTAPASDGGATITGYTVTPYIGATAQTPTTVGNVSSTVITGLTNGSTYTFKVAAINAIGTGPDSSASSSVTPAAGYADIVKVQQKSEKRQPSGANVSVTLDAAPTVGNVLVGCFTSVLNASITPPSGWTLVDSRISGAFFVGVYKRVVVGGDTAGPYVWTPGANSVMEATIIEFSGVDTSTPFVTPLTGSTAVPGSTSASLGPTGAPSLPKAAAIAVIGLDGNVTFSNTWNGGFTKLTGSGILYQEVATRIDNTSPSAYSTAEGWTPGRSVGAFIVVLQPASL